MWVPEKWRHSFVSALKATKNIVCLRSKTFSQMLDIFQKSDLGLRNTQNVQSGHRNSVDGRTAAKSWDGSKYHSIIPSINGCNFVHQQYHWFRAVQTPPLSQPRDSHGWTLLQRHCRTASTKLIKIGGTFPNAPKAPGVVDTGGLQATSMIGSPSSHLAIHPWEIWWYVAPWVDSFWSPDILKFRSSVRIINPIVNQKSSSYTDIPIFHWPIAGKFVGTLGQTIAARGRVEDQAFWLQ